MIYKAMFDAKSPTWRAYGRACFVEAFSFASAAQLAYAVARTDYPDSAIEVYALGESTQQAWDTFEAKRARYRLWMDNARRGIPNTPDVLKG